MKDLTRLMRVLTDEKPFICDTCENAFSDIGVLNTL